MALPKKTAEECHPPPISPRAYGHWLLWLFFYCGLISIASLVDSKTFSSFAYEWATTLVPSKWWTVIFGVTSVTAITAKLTYNNRLARFTLVVHAASAFIFGVSIGYYALEHTSAAAPVGTLQWFTVSGWSFYILGSGGVLRKRANVR